MYRILWHEPCEHITQATFATVSEANFFAQGQKKLYDIVWAGSGRVIPDWYRQFCVRYGQ